MKTQNSNQELNIVKDIYAAINRNDIPGALKYFAPDGAHIEFEGTPMGGTYRGMELKPHFEKARGTWAEGSCQPEELVVAGDKILVTAYVRVRLKDQKDWLEGHVADVFTFRDGKVIEMRTFGEPQAARKWAGV